MTKRERELRKKLLDNGLVIDRFSRTGNVHYQARVTAPDGTKSVIHFGCTPSDVRAAKNELATIRQHAEGRPHGRRR